MTQYVLMSMLLFLHSAQQVMANMFGWTASLSLNSATWKIYRATRHGHKWLSNAP